MASPEYFYATPNKLSSTKLFLHCTSINRHPHFESCITTQKPKHPSDQPETSSEVRQSMKLLWSDDTEIEGQVNRESL